MNSIQEFVEGKSVAIVGRAEYLNEIEQGELIDSYEVVVRTQSNLPYPSPAFKLKFDNDDSFVPKDYHHILGTKTTAFAPTNLPYWALHYCDDIIPKLIKRNCRVLIQHKIYNLMGANQIATIDYIKKTQKIPVFIASYDRFEHIVRTLDYTFPMPGTLLIDFINQHNPRSLYLTGFACYQDMADDKVKSEIKIHRDHKPLYDLRFLRDFVANNEHITVDDTLLNYFNNI